jgi:hypothetical protein
MPPLTVLSADKHLTAQHVPAIPATTTTITPSVHLVQTTVSHAPQPLHAPAAPISISSIMVLASPVWTTVISALPTLPVMSVPLDIQ